MSDPTLAALREAGADHHDPARFHYLEVLERRLATQPEAVRQLLSERLQAALHDYAQRVAQVTSSGGAVSGGPAATPRMPSAHAAPLTRLNRYIHDRTQAPDVDPEDGGNANDLKSVRGFSNVWTKIAADQQVAQAIDRGPDNAGPLNSHRLMLRSLALMRSLSPDYLGHFLAQMDTLLWLDQINQQTALKDSKPKRAVRAKK
ncbi:MAG: DUF2894 domain-containing protein [Aquabacterium sp.]|jgi:hypothetical protein|uniref:DUF2894 domain-containing protein n=1 Tax=Aquabacterium sp. TaxID=1872578 RepID=UPI002A36DA28|nr:DUF2894 domain-containing protein [Aquabacterium sp.]MDX9843892.1 DUF2894 domain-containing protein [Aquabacterium sp.]